MESYIEPCCCFDASAYTGTPDTPECTSPIPVRAIITELDALYDESRAEEAEPFLEKWLAVAREREDWSGELTMLSELLGQYRRSGHEEKGINTVNDALALVQKHHLGNTVSGATVLLNAATTLQCFRRAQESLPIFIHVSRVYSGHLDPTDYRLAGLYNNMAGSYAAVEDFGNAIHCYELALTVLRHCPGSELEQAVTFVSLAEIYNHLDPADEMVGSCAEKSWSLLSDPNLEQNGYYAFMASKCLPVLDTLGYFLYASELQERIDTIHERH